MCLLVCSSLFEFVIVLQFLPISLTASLTLCSFPSSIISQTQKQDVELKKDIRNVAGKYGMAIADTSAKRKRGVQKENTQAKIAVLITMADYEVVSVVTQA